MEQFLKKGALFLEKLNFRIFPLILLLKILSILSSFSAEKGSERFAEPQNRTSNLPNLYFCPKNRTSNQPNLKKLNEPLNRTRFVPSLLLRYWNFRYFGTCSGAFWPMGTRAIGLFHGAKLVILVQPWLATLSIPLTPSLKNQALKTMHSEEV